MCSMKKNGTEMYVYRVQVTPVVHILPLLLLYLSLPVTLPTCAFRTHGGFHPPLLGPSGHSGMRTPGEAIWRPRKRTMSGEGEIEMPEHGHGRGSSGPATPADGVWITEVPPRQALDPQKSS